MKRKLATAMMVKGDQNMGAVACFALEFRPAQVITKTNYFLSGESNAPKLFAVLMLTYVHIYIYTYTYIYIYIYRERERTKTKL